MRRLRKVNNAESAPQWNTRVRHPANSEPQFRRVRDNFTSHIIMLSSNCERRWFHITWRHSNYIVCVLIRCTRYNYVLMPGGSGAQMSSCFRFLSAITPFRKCQLNNRIKNRKYLWVCGMFEHEYNTLVLSKQTSIGVTTTSNGHTELFHYSHCGGNYCADLPPYDMRLGRSGMRRTHLCRWHCPSQPCETPKLNTHARLASHFIAIRWAHTSPRRWSELRYTLMPASIVHCIIYTTMCNGALCVRSDLQVLTLLWSRRTCRPMKAIPIILFVSTCVYIHAFRFFFYIMIRFKRAYPSNPSYSEFMWCCMCIQ